MSKFDRAIRWYSRQPRGRRAGLRALPITVTTYGVALLGGAVAESLDIDGFAQFAFVTAAIVGIVALLVFSMQALVMAADDLQKESARQREALSSAYDFADSWMLEELKTLTAIAAGHTTPTALAPADPAAAIQRLVQSAYDALAAHYGQAAHMDEGIDFEVTFMTKSYLDDEITIPAWANRDGRKPTSMQQRTSKPRMYERTVTADIYRAERPEMRIVEQTDDPTQQYAELYAGQKQRIKSSVVYPVLSSEYGLLGTLVLHCDRSGFFRERDRKFWRYFCEIFAKRLALEKLLLDQAMVATGNEQLGARTWASPPF